MDRIGSTLSSCLIVSTQRLEPKSPNGCLIGSSETPFWCCNLIVTRSQTWRAFLLSISQRTLRNLTSQRFGLQTTQLSNLTVALSCSASNQPSGGGIIPVRTSLANRTAEGSRQTGQRCTICG